MPFVPDSQQAAPKSRFVPDAADPREAELPARPGQPDPDKANSRPISEAYDTFGKQVGQYGQRLNAAAKAENDAPDAGLTGIADAALSAITSTVAPALASARGIFNGKEPTNADIEDFTRTPRTPAGKAHMNLLGEALSPISESGLDTALAPLAPEIAQRSAHQLPGVPKAPKVVRDPTNMADPVVAARAADYKLLPSEGGGGRIGRALESAMGPEGKKDFRRANQKKTTQLAQEDIGAPSLDEKGIAKVREEGDKAYNAMGGIGKVQADDEVLGAVRSLAPRTGMRSNKDIASLQDNFEGLLSQPWDAQNVVNEVRQLRKDANFNSSPPAVGAKPDPSKQSLAKAQIKVANALDDWLERNATTMGSPEIATEYRAARQRLAKTASVERATSGGGTDIRSLERQDDRGVPHSGRLKIASQTGEFFPESTGTAPGSDIHMSPDSLFGTVRNFAQKNLLRPAISRLLQSDMYQNRLGKALPEVSPDSPLGMYFDKPAPSAPYRPFAEAPEAPAVPPTQSQSMLLANKLAGDLGLEPEGPAANLPPAPSRMTADVPPPVRGDIPFQASKPNTDLAGDLGLSPEAASNGLRFTPSNLANSPLSLVEDSPARLPFGKGDTGGLQLADDLALNEVSPHGPFAYTRGERYTPDPRAASVPNSAQVQGGGAPGFDVQRIVDLASDLGLVPERQTAADSLVRVMPASRRGVGHSDLVGRPEGVDITHGNDRLHSNVPRGLADELTQGLDTSPELGDMDSLMSELNQLALRQRPSAAKTRVQNNASGESSASVEAINRVQAEKAAGQDRYLIDKDGTVRPLTGVDSVDAVARPGQVIVQKGVGADKYTILDRGGLNAGAARGRLNAALSSLDGG